MQGKTISIAGSSFEPEKHCPTLAEFQAMRRAAADRAKRAYAMLDAGRAEYQEAQRRLRSAKDGEARLDGMQACRQPDPRP